MRYYENPKLLQENCEPQRSSLLAELAKERKKEETVGG